MMVVTIDLDQEPIPLNNWLWCFTPFPIIMPCIVNVDVINAFHHLWEGGAITLVVIWLFCAHVYR